MEPVKNQPPPEASLHFLDYWRIIRIRKTVIISVFLLIAITATIFTFILTPSYSSTARIEINPDITDIPSMTGIQASAGYDPYFIQTEFEKMQGEKVLGRVIDALDLNDVWGKKLNGGVPLKTVDTMQLLKQHMSLSPERNTKLIDITVYSEDKQEAADLANGIAQAYQEYRLALRNTNTTGGIAAYVEEYRTEETQIPAIQTNLDRLRQELDIIDTIHRSKSDPQPAAIAALQGTADRAGKGLHGEADTVGRVAVIAGYQSSRTTGCHPHNVFRHAAGRFLKPASPDGTIPGRTEGGLQHELSGRHAPAKTGG